MNARMPLQLHLESWWGNSGKWSLERLRKGKKVNVKMDFREHNVRMETT
jgi:hypothetical protein